MKKFFYSKLFIGILCFCLGLVSYHLTTKISKLSIVEIQNDRFPVDPNDFDHDKILEAVKKMQQGMIDQDIIATPKLSGVNQHEDKDYFYYEIPLKTDNTKSEMKTSVTVKDGMINISEKTAHSEEEKTFSIAPGLDGEKAKVLNENDKIIVKIPKQK